MTSLKDIKIKEEYHSYEEDIINGFFMPCFSKCIEYDRCVEHLSIDMLKRVFNKYDNFRNGKAKLRLVTGHKFKSIDLDLIVILLSRSRNPFEKRKIKDDSIKLIRKAYERGQIEIKIAMTNNMVEEDTITDNFGIFKDMHKNSTVYISTSRSSFTTKGRLFESIDVYTSWKEATRVQNKIALFEKLWCNEIPYVDVYEFEYAAKNGYLKYWTEWVMHE